MLRELCLYNFEQSNDYTRASIYMYHSRPLGSGLKVPVRLVSGETDPRVSTREHDARGARTTKSETGVGHAQNAFGLTVACMATRVLCDMTWRNSAGEMYTEQMIHTRADVHGADAQ